MNHRDRRASGARRAERPAAAPLPAARRDPARPERLDLRADRALRREDPRRRRSATALDTYPNQLEVITAEQMMDAYASVGMPVNYRHWSLRQGVHRQREELPARPDGPGLRDRHQLRSLHRLPDGREHDGDAGAGDRPRRLRPQLLLQGQLPVPHVDRRRRRSSTTWSTRATTSPNARRRHGMQAVEDLLDTCHALMNHGVDRYHRPSKISLAEEQARREEREAYLQAQVNDIWRTLPTRPDGRARPTSRQRFPSEPQENLLYFIEKNAPLLEPWQREIVRIVRKVAQYFYPQRQTQVMNEGWATFWHYTLLNTLYDEGQLTDGFMIEWLKSHTNVVFQPPVGHPRLQRHQSLCAGLRHVHRHPPHLRAADRRGPRLVPGPRRHADWLPALRPRDAQLQGRELHRPVPVAQADPRHAAVRHPRRRARRSTCASRRSTTTHGYRAGARGARRSSTTSASREPDIQVWSVEPARRPLADPAPHAPQQPAAARQRRRKC